MITEKRKESKSSVSESVLQQKTLALLDGRQQFCAVGWGCLSGVYLAWYTFYAETP
jgi:hypothetical protein